MAVQTIQVSVSSNAYALACGIRNFVLALKTQVASGDAGLALATDLITDAVKDLVPVIQALSQLSSEEQEDLRSFIEAFEEPMKDIAFAFLATQTKK